MDREIILKYPTLMRYNNYYIKDHYLIGGYELILDNKTRREVIKSADQYRDSLLKDINLILRLINPNEKVHTTTLTKWDKDEITFEAPIERCDWVIFPLPIVLEICFITKQSIYMSRLEVTKSQKVGGKLLYKGQLLSPITKNQQRAHFRLAVLCKLQYRILPEIIKSDSILEDLPFYEGTIVNISVGGLCMVCEKKLEANETLNIQFHFLEHDFDIRGSVLNLGERNANGDFTHRIKFLDVDSHKMNLLSKLIFEKQRLLMQSAKVPLYK